MYFQRYKAYPDGAEKVQWLKWVKFVRPHLRTTPFARRRKFSRTVLYRDGVRQRHYLHLKGGSCPPWKFFASSKSNAPTELALGWCWSFCFYYGLDGHWDPQLRHEDQEERLNWASSQEGQYLPACEDQKSWSSSVSRSTGWWGASDSPQSSRSYTPARQEFQSGEPNQPPDPNTSEKYRDTPPISIAMLVQKYALLLTESSIYTTHMYHDRVPIWAAMLLQNY